MRGGGGGGGGDGGLFLFWTCSVWTHFSYISSSFSFSLSSL